MSKDQKTESLLKRGQYKFAYHEREPFENIDLKASEDNPARLKRKIDQLTVTQYGCAMLENAVFPAIVLLKQDQAKHLVATGMHRIRAAQEIDRDSFDAYIVTEPDQFRCDLLIRLLNGIEGRGDTVKEQLWHAISLHEMYPRHSLDELAIAFNLAKQTVRNAWHEFQGIKRSSRLGFDLEGAQKQPQNVIVILNQIPSDLVYVKAAEFVVHYDLTARDVEDMVRELKEVRNRGEGAEIEVIKKHHDIADERRRKAKARVGRTSPTACTRFIGQCRSINRQVRKGIEHLHLSALSNYDDAITVVDDWIDNAQKVKAELERIRRISSGNPSFQNSGLPMAAAADR